MGESWLDRLGNAGKSVLKTVQEVASESLPEEIKALTLDPAGIANLILLADRKGLLDDPNAESLKKVATRLSSGEEVPPFDLIGVVPDLLRMDLVKRLMPNAAMAERVEKAATAAKTAHTLGKLAGVGGTARPKTRPASPAAPTTPQVPDVIIGEPVTPAKPAPRRAPPKTPPTSPRRAPSKDTTTPEKRVDATRAKVRKARESKGRGGEGLK